MSKVTVVFGSPRKNSNTWILVDQAIKGLNEQGIENEMFYLNDMNIKGCQSCYCCKKNDSTKCLVNDDMQKIYKSMEESDGLIVGSPIYFCEVTAQTRLFIDRLFCYLDINLKSYFPNGKKVGFIITQNLPNRGAFTTHIESFKTVLCMLGYEKTGDLLVEDVNMGYKPLVTKNKIVMNKAYELGKNLL